MATVFFGLAGEGRGHAARAMTVIAHLRRTHRIVVLTFGQALEMLTPVYRGTEVEVRSIEGLRLRYGALGRMSPTITLLSGASYLLKLERRARRLATSLSAADVSLVVSDFEPMTLRAAKLAGVPALSLDHPRFLQACSFSGLPWHARAKIAVMARVIRHVYGKPEHMVISGFHLTPLRRDYEHAVATGVLIRPELAQLQPTHGEHLVAYFRRDVSARVLTALQACGRRVLVFGLGEQSTRGMVQFRGIQDRAFLDALASCQAVITTCGNQLIGEAFHLHKPVLAFPEPGNFEQQINAYLLNESGGGRAVAARAFDADCIQRFLTELDVYRSHLRTYPRCGNHQVEAYVDALLTGTHASLSVTKPYARTRRPSAPASA